MKNDLDKISSKLKYSKDCRFCDGKKTIEIVDLGYDEGIHAGFPIYHRKDKRVPHLGIEMLICTQCGHIDAFFEHYLKKFAGVDQTHLEEN